VRGLLESLPEVESCTVSNETKLAVIRLKPGATFPEALAREKLDADNFTLGAKKAPPSN
jgi:hypothetical protein